MLITDPDSTVHEGVVEVEQPRGHEGAVWTTQFSAGVVDDQLLEVREEACDKLQGARPTQHAVGNLHVNSPDMSQPAYNTVRGGNFKSSFQTRSWRFP